MLLMIDNYDSFTYNIVQYFGELGQQVDVRRNDEITLAEVRQLQPQYLVIGPGPCAPAQAGVSLQLILELAGEVPLLGICLGHQAIGEAFGGRVIRAKQVMHGRLSPVFHEAQGVFASLPNPVTVTRYHSLVIEQATLPDCLEVTAWTTADNQPNATIDEIMGVRHRHLPVEGVQFHPESILSEAGHELLRNFLTQWADFKTH